MIINTQKVLVFGGVGGLMVCTLMVLVLQWLGILRYANLTTPFIVPCDGTYSDCSVLQMTLEVAPNQCKKYARSITVRYGEKGFGGFTTTYGDISIEGGLAESEMRAILIHECGHVVDFFGLKGNPRGKVTNYSFRTMPTFSGDKSLEFYDISWESSKAIKKAARNQDFVTQYAALNPNEDFAETYAYYLLQRNAFEQRATLNGTLKKKYDYMKRLVTMRKALSVSSMWNTKIPSSTTDLSYEWLGGTY